jgi:hypothetical protein
MRMKTGLETAYDELLRDGPSFVVKGDRRGLMALYRELTASAQAWDTARAHEIEVAMTDALMQVMLEPTSRVKRGLFRDLLE